MLNKKETISYWKKKVWTVFSLYIRLKDADENSYSVCCTCSKRFYYKKIQAGHFIPGRHNIVLFNEELVHPQCFSCNFYLRGNPREYDKFMRKKYGDAKVEKFDNLSKGKAKIKQFTIPELQVLYEKYKDLLKNL